MSHYRTAVIVLNYHGAAVLPLCIASLVRAVRADDQILIVDNGHEETLLASLCTQYPQIKTLPLAKNGGFAAGMNAGIRHIQSEGGAQAYWLLNNDTVITPTALDALSAAVETIGDTYLFSPVIRLSADGPIWFAGGEIDFLLMKTTHDQYLDKNSVFSTGFLTGCALFIPARALSVVGLLDERYFLYAEDADYSLRAMRAGLGLKVVPMATVYHSEESRKSPEKMYWLIRSSAEFFLRESRGVWRGWILVYFTLRRLKNWFRRRFANDTLASEIERAYTDVSL